MRGYLHTRAMSPLESIKLLNCDMLCIHAYLYYFIPLLEMQMSIVDNTKPRPLSKSGACVFIPVFIHFDKRMFLLYNKKWTVAGASLLFPVYSWYIR